MTKAPTIGLARDTSAGSAQENTVNIPCAAVNDPHALDTAPFREPIEDVYVKGAKDDADARRIYLAWLLRTEQALNDIRKQIRFLVGQFGLEVRAAATEREAQEQDKLCRLGVDLTPKKKGDEP